MTLSTTQFCYPRSLPGELTQFHGSECHLTADSSQIGGSSSASPLQSRLRHPLPLGLSTYVMDRRAPHSRPPPPACCHFPSSLSSAASPFWFPRFLSALISVVSPLGICSDSGHVHPVHARPVPSSQPAALLLPCPRPQGNAPEAAGKILVKPKFHRAVSSLKIPPFLSFSLRVKGAPSLPP